MKTYTIEIIMPNIPKTIRQVVASSVKLTGDYFVFQDENGDVIAHYSTKNTIIKTITKSWKSYTEKIKVEDIKK